MSVLSTFLESSLNFLSNNLEKHYKIWYIQREKLVSKFKLSEIQFERTVSDKIVCKTHLE